MTQSEAARETVAVLAANPIFFSPLSPTGASRLVSRTWTRTQLSRRPRLDWFVHVIAGGGHAPPPSGGPGGLGTAQARGEATQWIDICVDASTCTHVPSHTCAAQWRGQTPTQHPCMCMRRRSQHREIKRGRRNAIVAPGVGPLAPRHDESPPYEQTVESQPGCGVARRGQPAASVLAPLFGTAGREEIEGPSAAHCVSRTAPGLHVGGRPRPGQAEFIFFFLWPPRAPNHGASAFGLPLSHAAA